MTHSHHSFAPLILTTHFHSQPQVQSLCVSTSKLSTKTSWRRYDMRPSSSICTWPIRVVLSCPSISSTNRIHSSKTGHHNRRTAITAAAVTFISESTLTRAAAVATTDTVTVAVATIITATTTTITIETEISSTLGWYLQKEFFRF